MVAPLQITTHNEGETAQLGRHIAACCVGGDCITLEGDLGAGKTVFSRGFIRARAGDKTDVASPTFTLMQSYDGLDGVPLFHFDFYRLESQEEIVETGLDDALERGITLIEWPQIAAGYIPEHCIKVHIAYGDKNEERKITVEAAKRELEQMKSIYG